MLTVVVVARKNPTGLSETLKALSKQTIKTRIIVVVDKFDTATYEIAKNYENLINAKILIDAGKGVYQAMNIGLSAVETSHVWFLNSGDLPSCDDLIERLSSEIGKHSREVSYCGNTVVLGIMGEFKKKYIPRNISSQKILFSKSGLSQPAFIYSTDKLKLVGGFDYSYKIAADTKSILQIYLQSFIIILDYNIANFYMGGLSTRERRKANAELLKLRLEFKKQTKLNLIYSYLWFIYRDFRSIVLKLIDT